MKVSNLQTVILSILFGIIGAGLTRFNIVIPGIILVIIGVLGIVFALIFNIYRKKAKVFPRDLIPWIVFRLTRNDPEIFPEINEKALKKHISLKLNECPSNETIKRIILYQGVVNHYQLVIEAQTIDSRYTNVQMFWEQDIHVLFGEHFMEVFRNKPNLVNPYQNGSFWNDWNCLVAGVNYPLPETLVDKKFKWVLYIS